MPRVAEKISKPSKAPRQSENSSTVPNSLKTPAPRSTKSIRSNSKKRTFQSARLDREFVSFCQLLQPVPSSAADGDSAPLPLSTRIRRRMKAEIEVIPNPAFEAPNHEAILGDVLLGTGLDTPSEGKTSLPNLPVHLSRLCETHLLNPEEERILFQRMNYLRSLARKFQAELHVDSSTESDLIRIEGLIRAADWYRDWIVRSNMRLVISIIKKFVNPNNRFDDLLSEGTMALIRAIDKFDFDRGFRFSTYATQVVRRSSYRSVMLRQKERLRIEASTSELDQSLAADTRVSAIDENRWQLLRGRLSNYLEHLDRREKLIIRARFSLGGHRKVQTLQRLADVLGVSKERIRQLEKRALDKLRDLATDEAQEGTLI